MKNLKAKLNLKYLAGLLTLGLVMFPWVSFRLNNYDLQPWFILFGLIYILFISNQKSPKLIVFGYVFPVIVYIISFFYNSNHNSLDIRALLSYLGLVVAINFYYLFRVRYYLSNHKNLISLFAFFNLIWITVGLLQKLLGKYILEDLVTVRTTEGRGVTGLSPEPTFYATVLICFSLILFSIYFFDLNNSSLSSRKNNTIILIMSSLNIISTIFLAQSSLGVILILFCALVFLLILKFDIVLDFFTNVFYYLLRPYGLIFMISLFFIMYLFARTSILDGNSRLVEFITYFSGNPLSIIDEDASINSRVAHLVLPATGAFRDFFVPHGFNSYGLHSESLSTIYGNLFWYGYGGNKIMSGLGSSLYELGVFSFLFLFWLVFLIWDNKRVSFSVASVIVIFAVLSTAIPIAFPFTAVMISELYYQKRYRFVAKKGL